MRFGPDIRRGLLEWNGEGEAVGGIVVMRYGENALDVIERVKKKFAELQPSFPGGVEMTDRLRPLRAHRALDRHPEARADRGGDRRQPGDHAVPAPPPQLAAADPVAARSAWRCRSSRWYLLDIPSTIMSLGGIAIAIGATVDAEIVMIEAGHKKLEQRQPGRRPAPHPGRSGAGGDAGDLLLAADHRGGVPARVHADRPGGAPVQAARLHEDVRHAHLGAAVDHLRACAAGPAHPRQDPAREEAPGLALPHPTLRALRLRGAAAAEVHDRDRPVRAGVGCPHRDAPRATSSCRRSTRATCSTCRSPSRTSPSRRRSGSSSIQDRMLRSFPEVETVFGKVGRAESATDPAPLTMVETTVQLRPPNEWRKTHHQRWYSPWAPGWLKPVFRPLWPEEQTDHLGRADHRDERQDAVPGLDQRLDHADQDAGRHVDHRRPHARSASRCSGPISTRWSASASRWST